MAAILLWDRPTLPDGANEEDAFRDILNERPDLRRKVFCVHTRLLNSTPPHGNTWEAHDFILHFLSVKGDRMQILRNAIAMAAARHMGD